MEMDARFLRYMYERLQNDFSEHERYLILMAFLCKECDNDEEFIREYLRGLRWKFNAKEEVREHGIDWDEDTIQESR